MYVVDLIGIPFDKMKCWDLVKEVYKRENKPLPDYTDMLNGQTVCSNLVEKINTPEKGCICVYSLCGLGIDHVAVYLGVNQIIHATEGSGVCIEPYSRYATRLIGLYRRKNDDSCNQCKESV